MILGLDLGATIGWVRGNAVGPLEHGEFALKDTSDLGLWLQSSDPFFRQALKGVKGIAMEQPFLGEDYYPARKLIALLGHVHYWARFNGISSAAIMEVPVSTGKLALSGHGGADKERMIAAAAERGYDGFGQHEADALGIWWVYVFGRREPIAKARTRSSKGKVIKPGEEVKP